MAVKKTSAGSRTQTRSPQGASRRPSGAGNGAGGARSSRKRSASAAPRTAGRSAGSASSARTSSGRAASSRGRQQYESRKRLQEQEIIRRDIRVILLFAAVVFLFLANFGILGPFGNFFRDIMFGLFGLLSYILPAAVLFCVLYYIAEEDDPFVETKIGGAAGILVILGIICALAAGPVRSMTSFDAAQLFDSSRKTGAGGGIVFGLPAYFLYKALRLPGTILVLIAAFTVCIILISRKSLLSMMEDEAKYARDRYEDYRLRREEERHLQSLDNACDDDGDDGDADEYGGYPQQVRQMRQKDAPTEKGFHPIRGIVGSTLLDQEAFQDAPQDQAAFSGDSDLLRQNPSAHAVQSDLRQEAEAQGNPAPSPVSAATQSLKSAAEPDTDMQNDTAHRDIPQSREPKEDIYEIYPQYTEPASPPVPAAAQTEAADVTAQLAESVPSTEASARTVESNQTAKAAPFSDRTDQEPFVPSSAPRISFAEYMDPDMDDAPQTPETEYDTPYALPEDQPVSESQHVETTAADAASVPVQEQKGETPSAESTITAISPEVKGTAPAGSAQQVEITRADPSEKSAGLSSASADNSVAVPHLAQTTGTANKEENGKTAKPRPYVYPPLDLLSPGTFGQQSGSDEELRDTAMLLQKTLDTFGAHVRITNISQGPAVTRYEMQPEVGLKVSRIVNLSDDIKLALAATDIRIEAPIPGKSAVGIEVPNKVISTVKLRDILDTPEFRGFKSRLAFGVGKDIAGKVVVHDIAKMPHVLIAGATGSGKSVCINTIIMSILYHASPEEVQLIMIDPKVVELSVYNGIPHLLYPVVTDPQKAAQTLNWCVGLMEKRYQLFPKAGVRNIQGYNEYVRTQLAKGITAGPDGNPLKPMAQVVIIVDELADLMMVAKNDVETAICRIAQLARAAGIHLIIATQRPSVDVITGLIKANMPSRIAFAVTSGTDSRTILDQNGAERLLGKGDMLFFPQGLSNPVRIQGAFVTDDEVTDVVDFIRKNNPVVTDHSREIDAQMQAMQQESAPTEASAADPSADELFADAGRFIIEKNSASIGLLQRRFRIGFNRAARIMDQLCEAGVVADSEGTKARMILMDEGEFETYLAQNKV